MPRPYSTDSHAHDLRVLRLSIVTETFPPEVNGVTLTLGYLIAGLRDRGHAVSVVRPQQAGDNNLKGDLPTAMVRGLPLPGYKELQFGLPAGRLLKRLWTRARPDAVYITTEGPLGWSAARAALRLAIPTLSGFHTNFHAYSRYYRCGYLHTVVLRYLRHLHNNTGGTLVPSTDLKQRLDGLGFRNVSLLGRGVDRDKFGPRYRSVELRRSWGLDERGVAIVYVGRLAPEKNLHVALDAYHAMRRAGAKIRFILIGDGPLRAPLQRQHPDLIVCGMKTGEQLARHYASGDVFLFPSETETFGNVTLEAMASELAVVAYDYAAAREHIVHGVSGLVAPFGDADAFIRSTVRLANEPGLIEHLRKRARSHAELIGWSRVVDTFEQRLGQVVRQTSKQSGAVKGDVAAIDAGRL